MNGHESGYIDADFLPPVEREDPDTYVNCTPHAKRQCDPMYVCAYHGDPEAGT